MFRSDRNRHAYGILMKQLLWSMCLKGVQVHRLMERDHLSLSEAQTRIDAQMPLSEKVKYATHVIRNDESLDKTREQVIAVYQHLC